MADETFDAIVAGAGVKSLITATYLQTYGGMKVGIFERRHELGGAWASFDGAAPGFSTDAHASVVFTLYFLPLWRDFPNFEDYGGKMVYYPSPVGAIFKEDQSCLVLYGSKFDPTGEKSAREIARFSERDAETYMKMREFYFEPGGWNDSFIKDVYSLPPPPGELGNLAKWTEEMMKRPDALWDIQFERLEAGQAARELFESVELRVLLLCGIPRRCGYPEEHMTGGDVFDLLFRCEQGHIVGGTHNAAHALIRIFVENGGKFFTKSEVDKLIIEDETAKGIRLVDGTEVRSQIVVTSMDPYQLCFRLIGEGHLDRKIMRRVAALDRNAGPITWYTWAVHELPNYLSAAFNPDINDKCGYIIIGNKDDEQIIRQMSLCRAGRIPDGDAFQLNVWGEHSLIDPSRVPGGKHMFGTELMMPSATVLSEREWMEFKKQHAEDTMRELQLVASNMTWDNVIGLFPVTPYDIAQRELNMAPHGSQCIIADRKPQHTFRRPIPEFADHRIPGIKNLYGTGCGWGFMVGAGAGQGYVCYKAIAEDLGLRKPWEEKNYPW